jgi:thymidylate synthase (FAD)
MIKEDISCEYIMHMGDDLNVVNNARVSFDKQSEWNIEWNGEPYPGMDDLELSLKQKDQGLIRFLATGFRKSEWNEMIQSVPHDE